MKHFLRALLLGSIFLTGCAAQHYVVLLNTGQRVVAIRKPHLEPAPDGFNFVFTDLNGRTNSIASERVRAVMPDTAKSTNTPSR
jgi:hypothetical protein